MTLSLASLMSFSQFEERDFDRYFGYLKVRNAKGGEEETKCVLFGRMAHAVSKEYNIKDREYAIDVVRQIHQSDSVFVYKKGKTHEIISSFKVTKESSGAYRSSIDFSNFLDFYKNNLAGLDKENLSTDDIINLYKKGVYIDEGFLFIKTEDPSSMEKIAGVFLLDGLSPYFAHEPGLIVEFSKFISTYLN